MARKIRIACAVAAYNVMARCNQGRAIYADERDRKLWLATQGEACEKTGWFIHAWVMMNNAMGFSLPTPNQSAPEYRFLIADPAAPAYDFPNEKPDGNSFSRAPVRHPKHPSLERGWPPGHRGGGIPAATPGAQDVSDPFCEGTQLMGTGDIAGAEHALRQALARDPQLAEAHANLGLLLDGKGQHREAEGHYRRALEFSPHLVQTHINLGALLAAQRRYAEAEEIYRRALSLAPESPAAWSNLGVLLVSVKREPEAERCFGRALASTPGYRSASFNLAYLLLRQGRYEEGWSCLESRGWHSPIKGYLDGFSRWQGESLEGKSLLIGAEAGYGDMIQFCRYAALIKRRGAARISVYCHPGLKRLFASLVGVDEVLTSDQPLPVVCWDYGTLPLSMPFLFQTTLDTIPADLPYLTAEPERIMHWAGIVGDPQAYLKVGLVWKGNPHFENNADRSLPSLSALVPLKDLTGIRYFSLQKGTGEEASCNDAPMPLMDLGAHIGDFADTAAIVMNLDLVITVDTAVAHLAGALGKLTWVLLSDYMTDWRWLKDRQDSPWYPKVMRLFRQDNSGSWATVIAEVKRVLQTLVEARGKPGRSSF